MVLDWYHDVKAVVCTVFYWLIATGTITFSKENDAGTVLCEGGYCLRAATMSLYAGSSLWCLYRFSNG